MPELVLLLELPFYSIGRCVSAHRSITLITVSINQALPNPAQTGRWKYQVITLGNSYETVFNVNTTSPYSTNTTICAGGSSELVVMNGGQNFTYQWLLNGTNISGATSDRYTTTQGGAYDVIATKNSVSNTRNTLTITRFNTLYTLKTGTWSDPTVWARAVDYRCRNAIGELFGASNSTHLQGWRKTRVQGR